MKKLEDFQFEKIELGSIYGGKMRMVAGTFDSNTVTLGAGAPADGDDGSDEADDPF